MQSKTPQRSDWSPNNLTISYNQQSLNTTKCNQTTDTLPTIRDRKRRIKSMFAKCVQTCSSIPPMYVGLLVGVLAGAILLAILIPLWLSPIHKTSTTTTSSTTTSATTTSATTTSSTTTSSTKTSSTTSSTTTSSTTTSFTTTSSTTTSSTTTSATTTSSTTSSTTTSSTTSGILSLLTTTNETVYAIWNTTAAGDSTPSTAGTNVGGYFQNQGPQNLFDQNVNDKYTSFGVCASSSTGAANCGINTGCYLTLVRGPSLLTGLRFCAADSLPVRDPLTITIEGSNQPSSTLTQGTSWTLIYTGSTGLDIDPGRRSYGRNISLSNNSVWFTSYRFLVTSKRGVEVATQYAEIETTGY